MNENTGCEAMHPPSMKDKIKNSVEPDDIGEWDEAWNEEVGRTLKQSVTKTSKKLNQLNKYLDELYELNGSSGSWCAAIKRMKEIIGDKR